MRENDLAHQLQAAPHDELTATRRDLQTGIAMMRRGSPSAPHPGQRDPPDRQHLAVGGTGLAGLKDRRE